MTRRDPPPAEPIPSDLTEEMAFAPVFEEEAPAPAADASDVTRIIEIPRSRGRLGWIVLVGVLAGLVAGGWWILRTPEAAVADAAPTTLAPRRTSPGTIIRPRRGGLERRATPSAPPSTPASPDARRGFVRIPAGSFEMGSPPGEAGRGADEALHTVEIAAPLMVKITEVTQDEWAAVMDDRPAYNAGCGACPVERVSWFDAAEYANRRSVADGLEACYRLGECTGEIGGGCGRARDGDRPLKVCSDGYRCEAVEIRGPGCTGYRLPTEAEWEYLARAGSRDPWPGVDDPEQVGDIAWFAENADDRTHPVGRLGANAWGIRDVCGNVWEWTETRGRAGFVDRGGMYRSAAAQVRVARRNDSNPPARRGFEVGFRLVRSLPP